MLNPNRLRSLSWVEGQVCFHSNEEETIPNVFWVGLGNAFEFLYTLRKGYKKLTILGQEMVFREGCG